ncbi:hypothetical protein V5F34_00905 [Xanthobacter autotrophicus]|uniref:hypothetical protein n=1 Tax=Xanthobacter autotrophicus TaxID=280 RepID=UPI00372B0AE2
MAGKSPAGAGKSPARRSGEKVMSSLAEARNLIVEIAGPISLGERVKTVLASVAVRSGLPERRVRGIWHREAKAVLAEELSALHRAAALRKREEAIDARNLETRARLEARRAATSDDVEGADF